MIEVSSREMRYAKVVMNSPEQTAWCQFELDRNWNGERFVVPSIPFPNALLDRRVSETEPMEGIVPATQINHITNKLRLIALIVV